MERVERHDQHLSHGRRGWTSICIVFLMHPALFLSPWSLVPTGTVVAEGGVSATCRSLRATEDCQHHTQSLPSFAPSGNELIDSCTQFDSDIASGRVPLWQLLACSAEQLPCPVRVGGSAMSRR
jgi:hypothetical protein